MNATKKTITTWEIRFTFNGRAAGTAGPFATKAEAEAEQAFRLARSAPSGRIVRVRTPIA